MEVSVEGGIFLGLSEPARGAARAGSTGPLQMFGNLGDGRVVVCVWCPLFQLVNEECLWKQAERVGGMRQRDRTAD